MQDYEWYVDLVAEDQMHCYKVEEVIVDLISPYQKIQIIKNPTYGKCLIIDGKMQSAEKDEFIYHETLIHPALILHPNPKNVLVIGAGEGATLRELLKYENLSIVAVEIDPNVVDFAEKYLWEWHQGAFRSDRVRLVFEDGWNFVRDTNERFDVVVLDLPEPYPDTPAYRLYTEDFYKMVYNILNPSGIVVTQAETVQLGQEYKHFNIKKSFSAVFKSSYSYQTFIPSFDGSWGFLIGSRDNLDPFKPVDVINKLISQRIKGELKYYDGETHNHLFHLPKYLRGAF
ncbi:MAG: polyamine aminopropyltransferase [Dictyoglomus thermophilum]|uniref:Polyamine aminopropyltransferase n=1 Tax=Dictyoglomus thermophilum TaxID=14 RepID=A0A7C3PP91_DICTH|nr:polyamine aminopropyltransferase [Dictyoglomus thermophilum]MCX7719972.1 polyamine aminopropyltransferase [Dictyoglomus thermophilum]TYT22582.1 polyamine aminopropyltransferase [Dictyoglomus thermophilum]